MFKRLGSGVVLKRHGLKRHGSGVVFKRHGSSVELLPHDVVELILEGLGVKNLRRFRSVCKKWRSTIDSRRFQERQLIRHRQSRGPQVLFVSLDSQVTRSRSPLRRRQSAEIRRRQSIVLGSCIVRSVRLPFPNLMVCHGSCDGLVCLYYVDTYDAVGNPPPNVLVNPATQWHRSFPFSRVQQLYIDRHKKGPFFTPTSELGFGKDKFGDTYKPVWLYNSAEFGLNNVTTCEVFDFTTNAWRYVVPASPYRILHYQKPVYLDGSLFWITDCFNPKVLSFDLHTETFQVLAKTPFAYQPASLHVTLCILDNRLCVSETTWPTQFIWSFDSSGGNKTWKKLCSIDVTIPFPRFSHLSPSPLPVAILDKNNKLMLHSREDKKSLVLYDLNTKSYDLVSAATTPGHCVSYFETFFSV